MGKDEFYARVQEMTEDALERLSLLTPGLTEFLLHYWAEIRRAGDGHLIEEERTGLTNLSFFYFLATCIDFLFFLHLRHRHVNIYQHELEHILSVMMTHAKTQREVLAAEHAHGPPEPLAIQPGHIHDPSPPFNLVDFTEALRRLKEKSGNGDPQ